MSSKNKSRLEAGGPDHVPPGAGLQPRQHQPQPTQRTLQTLLQTLVTNPSTSSKPPLKPAVGARAVVQLVLLAKHHRPPRVFYGKVLGREPAPERVLDRLVISNSCEVMHSSSNYDQLCRHNHKCSNRFCSKSARAIRSSRR